MTTQVLTLPHSGCLADYAQVDMLGVWYTPVNCGAVKSAFGRAELVSAVQPDGRGGVADGPLPSECGTYKTVKALAFRKKSLEPLELSLLLLYESQA